MANVNLEEMNKLEDYLKSNNVPYKREDRNGVKVFGEVLYGDRHQITGLDEKGEYKWDVICHYGSYGFEAGLLEFYDGEDVDGFLTAEDVIRKITEVA